MNIDFNEDRPDVRFWTDYDHFMVMREARAMRGKYLRGLVAEYKARIARLLGSARTRQAATARVAG
ncbi:MAG: hypothetical protein U1F41_03230 [Burkholderiales bacterium]